MNAWITWHDAPSAQLCPVCHDSAAMREVANAGGVDREPIVISRCGVCGSLHLTGQITEPITTEHSSDDYIEAGAGLDTIAEMLHRVDPSGVRRFLDVGCNYGFAPDLGRFLHGWEVLGVEPSAAGRRGQRELGLPILDVYLDENTDVGDPYDLILASEVVEHVPDPESFLRTLRGHLTENGALLLTTPAAELVDPIYNDDLIVLGLSPGNHNFILSEAGLRTLLERAGFTRISVERRVTTLFAVASTSDVGDGAEVPPIDRDGMTRYFDARADSAEAGSVLGLGMAVRHLRATINAGRWDDLERSRGRLTERLLAGTGLDLSQPAAAEAAMRSGTPTPLSMAGVAHSLGVAEMQIGSKERAAEYFRVALTAIDQRALAELLDGEMLSLRIESRGHLALILAETDPAQAVAELETIVAAAGTDPDLLARTRTWQARTFVTMVVTGGVDQLAASRRLHAAVAADADGLADSDDPIARVTGLDALYALGIAELHSGQPTAARDWFARCRAKALARPDGDAHARNVAELAAAADAEAVAALGREAEAQPRGRLARLRARGR